MLRLYYRIGTLLHLLYVVVETKLIFNVSVPKIMDMEESYGSLSLSSYRPGKGLMCYAIIIIILKIQTSSTPTPICEQYVVCDTVVALYIIIH